MAKYLKIFETTAAYNTAKPNLILPNVSLITETHSVAYNPSSPTPPTETRLVCKYNVTSTSEDTQLISEDYYSGEEFEMMEIDGVEQNEILTTYRFDTLGEHTIKYTLADPTTISEGIFLNCSSLTNVNIPDSVTSIKNWVFRYCSGLTSVTIPNSVTTIYNTAFCECNSLDAASVAAIEAINPNIQFNC